MVALNHPIMERNSARDDDGESPGKSQFRQSYSSHVGRSERLRMMKPVDESKLFRKRQQVPVLDERDIEHFNELLIQRARARLRIPPVLLAS